MKKKLLITGGNGMLASSINDIIIDQYNILKLNKGDLDITDFKRVEEVIINFKPNYIIHTAALTNVDLCEDQKQLALKINGIGTENVSKCCEIVDAKMVYISTCGLFGDEIRAYNENDSVVLKTEYAKSKYYGEKAVEKICEKAFIVRPGWLFGGSKNHKKNFVYNRYLEAKNKDIIISAADKFGCPTYTLDLANKIVDLLETDNYGLYHVSNYGSASRYSYVKKIINSFKLNIKVEKGDSTSFKRSAPVPDCEIIENMNLKLQGFELLPDWENAIERYVHDLKLELNI